MNKLPALANPAPPQARNLARLPAQVKREIPAAQLPAAWVSAVARIKACESLEEIKGIADEALAMATFALVIKRPDMEIHARRVRLNAIDELGARLNKYSSRHGPKLSQGRGCGSSERSAAAAAAGLNKGVAKTASRFNASSARTKSAVFKIAPLGLSSIQNLSAARRKGTLAVGDAYRTVFGSPAAAGLSAAFSLIARVSSSIGRNLSTKDAERARPKILALIDWLDEFERNLPKPAKAKGAK